MVLFSSVQFLSAWTKSFMSAIITNLISVLERNSFHHVQLRQQMSNIHRSQCLLIIFPPKNPSSYVFHAWTIPWFSSVLYQDPFQPEEWLSTPENKNLSTVNPQRHEYFNHVFCWVPGHAVQPVEPFAVADTLAIKRPALMSITFRRTFFL